MERIGIYLLIAIIALIARPFVRGWLGEKGTRKISIFLYVISIAFLVIVFMQRYHDGQLVKKW